jgi:hypothetical protein
MRDYTNGLNPLVDARDYIDAPTFANQRALSAGAGIGGLFPEKAASKQYP